MAGNNPNHEHLKKQLRKIALASSDIRASFETCRLAQKRVKNVNNQLYHPLLEAAIISYARPFTDNKPHGSLPAKFSRYKDALSKGRHRCFMKYRHQIVAHSDPFRRAVFIVPPARKSIRAKARAKDLTVAVSIESYEIKLFGALAELCKDLLMRLDREEEKLKARLYDGVVLENGLFKL